MNTPLPFQNPFLLGHESAAKQFLDGFQSGKMHHAWLISGNEGIGKATLAAHFAHTVLSNGSNKPGQIDMQNPVARLIAAESHPDLFILRRPADEKTGALKDVIPVEEARKIAPFLRLTPTHSKWRVAVIDEAQCLNRHGQNTILKVIEEPPPACLILMTVTTPGAMLPTIRSRCRALPLHPLEPQMLETLMARYDIDCGTGAEKARLLALAGGSLGFAQKIIETGALAILDEIAALFAGDMDVARCHRLAEKFAKKADADSFFVLSDILREILRQQILAGTRSTEAPQDLPSFYKGLPLDRLLQLWDKLGAIFHRTDVGNLDRKLAFINAMIEIRRASA